MGQCDRGGLVIETFLQAWEVMLRRYEGAMHPQGSKQLGTRSASRTTSRRVKPATLRVRVKRNARKAKYKNKLSPRASSASRRGSMASVTATSGDARKLNAAREIEIEWEKGKGSVNAATAENPWTEHPQEWQEQ